MCGEARHPSPYTLSPYTPSLCTPPRCAATSTPPSTPSANQCRAGPGFGACTLSAPAGPRYLPEAFKPQKVCPVTTEDPFYPTSYPSPNLLGSLQWSQTSKALRPHRGTGLGDFSL